MTTTIKAAPLMHSPPHPGAILRGLYLAPMRVTIIEAAQGARCHQQARVGDRERARAHHGGHGDSGSPRHSAPMRKTWVNLQAQRDLWVASQKAPPNVKPIASGGVITIMMVITAVIALA
jgi:plasmid maintenance system antidote protein VapI